ncbi:MAG: hypothetical protein ISR65_07085 [Bacteriovoracaceae bacterium]|nr:hypothetical protein [Bacteriovoracaceae bacterium]
MKKVAIVLLICFPLFSIAADRFDVRQKLGAIRKELKLTRASSSELDEVIAHLDRAHFILQDSTGGGSNRNECFEYAYEKYFKSYSSSQATDAAVAACKVIDDVAVARVLYTYAYKSLNAAGAMDLVVEGFANDLYGKNDIVVFVADKYYKSFDGATTAKKAAKGAGAVNDLSCLQTLYPKYYRSMDAASAMDKAITSCR